MNNGDVPVKFSGAWGYSAVAPYIRAIPATSQIGIPGRDGWASLETGFVPLNFEPLEAGGVPPFGQDLNGVLFQATSWARWQAAGGPINWDATFGAAIGGYPKGAVVAGTTFGIWWLSTVDANTTNPNTGGAGWFPLSYGVERPGRIVQLTGATAGPGEILAQGQLLSRTTYAAYWAWVQGSGNLVSNDGGWTKGTYSPGDGSTTFRIPDLRDQFLRGASATNPLGTDRLDAVQGHEHSMPDVPPKGTTFGYTGVNGVQAGAVNQTNGMISDGTHGTPRIDSETRPVMVAYPFAITTGLLI